MLHKLVASAAFLRSSGFSSYFLPLLTVKPAASGIIVLVTLLKEDVGENATIPTKMKANIKIRRMMDQTRETIISSNEIPSWFMTS